MNSGLLCCTLLAALLLQVTDVDASYRSVRVRVRTSYSSYYYYGSYSSYVYYFPLGGIIGSIVGALVFIGAVIAVTVFFCCVRKRRLAATSRRPTVAMTLGTPITTVSGNNTAGGVNYPKQDGQSNEGFVGTTSLPPPYPEPGMQQPAGNGFQQPQMPHQAGGYYPTDQPQYPQQQPPAYHNFAQNDQTQNL